MSWLSSIFSSGPKTDFKELAGKGAQIIDVRTTGEYRTGFIRGSVNIPLNELPRHYKKLKKDRPIITCCASGMRSATARNMLRANGFTEVYNGGSWSALEKALKG